MKPSARPPVIRLMTVTEAATELDLPPAEIDRLVDTGDLHALKVSPHGGRRFWPADVQACAAARADARSAVDDGPQLLATSLIDPTAAATGEASMPQTAIATSIATSTATMTTDASRIDEPRPAASLPPRARTRPAPAQRHPRWQRFEASPERSSSNYLAFRDAEHVTAYLRARATLEPDPSGAGIRDPRRRELEVITA